MTKITFDVDKKVTTDLPVKPVAAYGDNVVGEIVSIELVKKLSENKKGTSSYQYTEMEVPSLVISFKQKIDAYNKEDRFAKIVFRPTITVKNSGQDMAADVIDSITQSMFGHLLHIYEAFEGTDNFKKLKKMNPIDISGTKQEILDSNEAFFQAWVDIFKGKNGEGSYKGIDLAIKFIVNKDERYLSIPNYVNRGYVKVANFNTKGVLTNPVEFFGESITIPKAIDNNANAAGTTAAPVSDVNLDDMEL